MAELMVLGPSIELLLFDFVARQARQLRPPGSSRGKPDDATKPYEVLRTGALDENGRRTACWEGGVHAEVATSTQLTGAESHQL